MRSAYFVFFVFITASCASRPGPGPSSTAPSLSLTPTQDIPFVSDSSSVTTVTPDALDVVTPTDTPDALDVVTPTDTPRGSVDTPPTNGTACVEQPPQPFLIRRFYTAGTPGHGAAQHRAAIRYRTENYGYFEGFGDHSLNAHPPRYYSVTTRFMGLAVTLNRRIVPALRCVEEALRRTCTEHPYRPTRLNGLRPANSFQGGEVSNHVYGIAIDIDSHRNPCCGCGRAFANHPNCRRRATTPYSRMDLPECWVHVFERYGFYWLGHDRSLRDQMHFEFLGDPALLPHVPEENPTPSR